MTAAARPRLVSLEIRGFRAFGTEARVLQLDTPLVVVHAGNSQGKTSFAEAIEFLVSGRSSRRELLGGAKAEYNDSLRNAHLPPGDNDVYVEAQVRDASGTIHRVRRELVCDFGQGAECESRLLVDGTEVTDLGPLGIQLSDPPVRAPVLLQHILRHVLSTEPKQRVGYFKALLELTDLDLLRDRVKAARSGLEAQQPGAALLLVDTLVGTPAAPPAAAIKALIKKTTAANVVRDDVERALIDAGGALLGEPNGATNIATLKELDAAVRAALAAERDKAFPLTALLAGPPIPQAPEAPDPTNYNTALAEAERRAARITPLIEAVLTLDEYANVREPVACPVCGTDHALTPERVAVLHQHLERTRAVDEAARGTARMLNNLRRDLDQLINAAQGAVPQVAGWSTDELAQAQKMLQELNGDVELLTQTYNAATTLSAAAGLLKTSIAGVRTEIDKASEAVASREQLPAELTTRLRSVTAAVEEVSTAAHDYSRKATAVRTAVELATRDRAGKGLGDLAELITRSDELITNIVDEAARQRTIKRLTAAERALREAAGAVLDGRFAQMSTTITGWWATIRPEELVGFGGIKRRAGGALYVNLVAALRAELGSDPIERDALGVYSDSQLNALGLSIFLARTELLGSPIVVLDDPIPGSDPAHRLTFVQNTLGRLLDSGVQLVLTTFDSKLADWAQANHDWRGLAAYELNLLNAVAGTEPTQTSDTFSRLLLEAEENLNAPTPRGRRAACGSYRSAAERLAKQIVATGRTHDGQPTSVDDVDSEASVLGQLVPLVNGYALDNAEKGQWRTFANVLNPGNHDDDVPSTPDLKQVRGNLRKIAKNHQKHWPSGLLL